MSELIKGKKHSPETLAKMKGRPSAFKGKTHTDESRAQMSAALKGRAPTFAGRTHSSETRAKISAAKTGKPLTPAQVEGARKAAEANRGRKNSPETIEKMRASAAKRDPTTYARGPRPTRSNGYAAIHAWLRYWHPRAGRCEDCGGAGGKKGTHYAFLRHPEPYTRDRADYMELCSRCHSRFDRSV